MVLDIFAIMVRFCAVLLTIYLCIFLFVSWAQTSFACPQAPWAPEFGLNTSEDEIDPAVACSDLHTRFSCRFRNFCCFENNRCFPANAYGVECVNFNTQDLCARSGCKWDGRSCRRVCPFTSDPSLLCNVLSQIPVYEVIPTTNPTHAPTEVSKKPTKSPTTKRPTGSPTFKPTKAPISKKPTKSPSSKPTKAPVSKKPTKSPTTKPTKAGKTKTPTISQVPVPPSNSPTTASPTTIPSKNPVTSKPSKSPKVVPTKKPTVSPTKKTKKPTKSPTNQPTRSPVSSSPSNSPLTGPTKNPTLTPTIGAPTKSPSTSKPSKSPSTSKPSKSPVTSKPSKAPVVPTKKPTKSRPTKRKKNRNTKKKSPSPTKQPSTPSPTNQIGWSPLTGLIKGVPESNPGVPCSLLKTEETCSEKNFCCWDVNERTCFMPARSMHDLECPLVKDREACDKVHGIDCAWVGNTCRRKEPPVTLTQTAAKICAKVTYSRRMDAKERGAANEYCWVKDFRKPCVFPFTVNGRRFDSCASYASQPPESGRGITTSQPTGLWCPVVPDSKKKSVDGWGYCTCTPKKRNRSILMVIADDFRPDVSAAYGRKEAKTPFLDELVSREGTVIFDRAYSNYPVCGPSRDSFLSSLLPDVTKVYNFGGEGLKTDPEFRAKIKTIPQLFREAGYYTVGGGKIFHLGHEDPLSWDHVFEVSVEQNSECAKDKKATVYKTRGGVRVEHACHTTAALDTLLDYRTANSAVQMLDTIVQEEKEPFFMGIGFYKPHTPFHVHKKFWNQYVLYGTGDAERQSGPVAQSSYPYPELTFNYDSDIMNAWGKNPWGEKSGDFRKIMRTGYLAAIMQMDDALGRVLVKLEELNLDKSTLVVVLGDHGYYLGENNLFAKDTNFELAVRVPMIFHVPWLRPPVTPISFDSAGSSRQLSMSDSEIADLLLNQNQTMQPRRLQTKALLPMSESQLISGNDEFEWNNVVAPNKKRTRGFAEMIDVMPTLASLMGIPMHPVTNGTDQSRLISAVALGGSSSGISNPRSFTFSQVNRCPSDDCRRVPVSKLYAAGYSVRTDRWRFTVFVLAPGGVPQWDLPVLSLELYTHDKDDETLFNYAAGTNYDTEYQNVASIYPQVCQDLLEIVKQRFG